MVTFAGHGHSTLPSAQTNDLGCRTGENIKTCHAFFLVFYHTQLYAGQVAILINVMPC